MRVLCEGGDKEYVKKSLIEAFLKNLRNEIW